MDFRNLVTAMVLGASMLTGEGMYASPVAVRVPVDAMFGNVKTVKFSLHNNTADVVKVKVGDTERTLAPGKTVDLKLPVGAKVVAETESKNYHVGDVVATATQDLTYATVICINLRSSKPKGGYHDERKTRRFARNTCTNGPQNSRRSGHAAWLGNCTAHRAN
jgi:hypothetical protein